MLRTRPIAFAGFVVLIGIVGYWIFPPSVSSALYLKIAYPVILAHVCLLVFFLFRCSWFRVGTWRKLFSKDGVRLWIVYVVCALIFCVHHELGFKTLGDEGLVASVSQNLHGNRSPEYIWRAYSIDGDFSVVESHTEKRPIAFAVMESLVHDLTGYRVENGFYLNLFLGLLILAMMGWIGLELAGQWGSALGMLLVPSVPLISYYAHGGGIDILNLTMILATLCLGLQWSKHRDPDSFLAYVYAAGLLAMSRYESILFLFPVALSILLLTWKDRSWEMPKMSFPLLALLLLIPLQQAAFRLNSGFWELDSKPEASGVFGLQYLGGNLAHALAFLSDTTNTFPNSPVVFWAGIGALLILSVSGLIRLTQKTKPKPMEWILLFLSLGMLMHFAVMMVYFYGQFDSPILHRFALPFYGLLMIASVALLGKMKARWMRMGWIGIFLLGLIFYSVPTASTHAYEDRYIPSAHAKWVSQFVKKHPPRNYMVIDFNPLLWTTREVGAINYSRANMVKERIRYQLNEGAMKEIYVIEVHTRDDESGVFSLSSDARLDDDFELELLSSEILSPSFILKLKRIVSVKMDKNEGTSSLSEPESASDDKSGQRQLNREQTYYLNLP